MNSNDSDNPGSHSLRSWFEAAMEQPTDQRSAWIEAHVGDPAQRSAVLRLLAAESARGLLDTPSAERAERIGSEREFEPVDLIGRQIGAFTLVRSLGQGGMAAVFLGERRDGDFQQQVAIKLLRRGLYSEIEQRLFRRERQALASLAHPNIAHLIDGGVTEAGIPYLVLEYVDGVPITDFATREQLGLRARLRLFVVVCQAVAAAHHNLIVHRDIKPANILVDASGRVKLLDFGIAKLLDDDIDGATRTDAVAMTPGYAAPEQYSGGIISTATDVYALGVLMHELLLGVRPVHGDSEPRRPSMSVMADDDTRKLTRASLRNALRGDLDNILLKALAIEPQRRYASAANLADDIERYLSAQPVTAHPPSNWYRTRKFVQRHRGGVTLTAAFAIALIASLAITLWQARVARNEAARANAQTALATTQAQRAESVRDFLLRVFHAAEPAGPRLAPPSVADVVRVSIAEAQRSTTLSTSVRVELIEALGTVLREQGDTEGSLKLLAENHDAARRAFGPNQATTILAGIGEAEALMADGKLDRARAMFDEMLQHAPNDLPVDVRVRLLDGSNSLAVDRFERERALADSKQAIAICESGCSARARIQALSVRGLVLASFAQDAEAISVLQQALILQKAFYSGPDVAIADTEQLLSRAHRRLGQLDEAEKLARSALATVEASVPDPHVRRADALDTVWQVLIDERKLDEAEAFGKRVIAMNEVTLGLSHPGLATSHATLGYTYLRREKYPEAISEYRVALAISEKIPDNQRRSAIYQSQLGASLGYSGKLAEGVALIDTAIATLQAQAEPDWGEICAALEKRGGLQLHSGRLAAAQESFETSNRLYQEKLPDAPTEWRAVTLIGLGRALGEHGDVVRAETTLREAIALVPLAENEISTNRIEARAALAVFQRQRGNSADADQLLAQVRHEAALAPDSLSPRLASLIVRAATIKPKPLAR